MHERRVPNPSPGFMPVSADDLATAAITYRQSATVGLNLLVNATDSLTRVVDSGNLALAKQASLLALFPTSIITTDPELIVTSWNEAAENCRPARAPWS